MQPAGHLRRSQMTRVIHLVLLLAVIHQLLGSEVMQRPFPGDPPGWALLLHEYVGLGSLAVVGLFWLWTLLRRRETRLSRLVPWLSIARTRDVFADLAWQLNRLAHLRPPADDDGALASAVHGLGLLAVTAMAVTGTVTWFDHGALAAHYALDLHKLIANLVWAYLIGHAGLAVLHHLFGSDIFSRMFWTRR